MAKTSSHKSNGSTSASPSAPIRLALSKQEQAALRDHNARIGDLKLELANVALQRAELAARERELCERIHAEAERYQREIRATARAKGLDVDQQVAFDPVEMTLTGVKA